MRELIVNDKVNLYNKVNNLLNDKEKLIEYHKNLKNALINSDIMNYKKYTEDLENLYTNLVITDTIKLIN